MSEIKSLEKIKISKLVSTLILGITFSILLLFGLIFYMYFDPRTGYTAALNQSFTITASLFGGVTTLVAAYIASQLFDDWKDEKEYELTKETSLSLLEATLSLNSTIENLLAVIFEFRIFNNHAEFVEYTNYCNQYTKDFMQNIISIKTQNNKHHGLVLDFEKDEKLFLPKDMQLAMDVLHELEANFQITFDNYNNKTSIPLNPIDLTDYSSMIKSKIKYLNKQCKPRSYNN